MGIFKKDELILDFKGVRTEDMSSTIPYMNKLTTDAKMLVNHLGPNANANRKGLVLFNEGDNFDLYKIFEKSNNLNNNDNNFSETSPFISSDVYNQLLSKLKGKNQMGGADEDTDDSSEESSTTSSSESDSDKKKKKIKKMFKNSDDINLEDEEEEEEFSEMSMSAGSYLSSSAHTDGTDSSNSNASSTISAKHKGRNNMSDSVNTSDINIISIDN
jgi:hypothetical protein